MTITEAMNDLGMRLAYHNYLNDWRNQTISYEEFVKKATPRPVLTNPVTRKECAVCTEGDGI